MQIREDFLTLPPAPRGPGALQQVIDQACGGLVADEAAVRLAITESSGDGLEAERGVMSGLPNPLARSMREHFSHYLQRTMCNEDQFNAVMLIPTGIGAELGGHSGDGGAACRLLAATCDTLITHPNVVNGADLNELPDNGLYVEGSLISRLMMGDIALRKTRANRILVVVDQHRHEKYRDAAVNMASAARVTAGYSISDVVLLDEPLEMEASFTGSGRAAGSVRGLAPLFRVLERRRGDYDAVAIASVIVVPEQYHSDYFQPASRIEVNPWGGVEAMLTHAVSTAFNVPSAHAPMMSSPDVQNLSLGRVDPRKASEAVSLTYFFCVLKGLHRSPGIVTTPAAFSQPGVFSAQDLHALVIPDGCVGLPTLAALEQGIPVIAVRGNRNIMRNDLSTLPFAKGRLHYVENYLEAAGLLTAMRAGVSPESVQRPLQATPCQPASTSPQPESESASSNAAPP